MERWAVIDETEQYRYTLTRIWDPKKWRLCFVMLNPSTADGYQDDPTIRRCIGFAQAWGYGSLEVVNLYAFRASQPEVLWHVPFPVGKENDHYIREAVQRSTCVVAAWGAGAKCRVRTGQVLSILRHAVCLGRTKSGAPRHPLYVPYDIKTNLYVKDGVVVE
jgi:hypothetical protein